MKLTSHLFTSRKIVLGAVSLVYAASTAFAGVAERESILQEANTYSGALSINPASYSPQAGSFGALTLDSFYSFDYASAGIGTVVFRAQNSRPNLVLESHDVSRPVGLWNTRSSSFNTPLYFDSSPFDRGSGSFDSQSIDGENVVAAPEPSTWLAGTLALLAIGFVQRGRLRGLIGRHA
jgi:hypothetical protein